MGCYSESYRGNDKYKLIGLVKLLRKRKVNRFLVISWNTQSFWKSHCKIEKKIAIVSLCGTNKLIYLKFWWIIWVSDSQRRSTIWPLRATPFLLLEKYKRPPSRKWLKLLPIFCLCTSTNKTIHIVLIGEQSLNSPKVFCILNGELHEMCWLLNNYFSTCPCRPRTTCNDAKYCT